MMDLENALIDLGDHLDVPDGDELVQRVVIRLSNLHRDERWGHRNRHWLVAAAIVVAVLAVATTFAPAREAVARWLGIGAIEIQNTPGPLPPGGVGPSTVPGVPRVSGVSEMPRQTNPAAAADLAAAQAKVGFTILLPRGGIEYQPRAVAVDGRIPGGLVAISYDRFSLVELASGPGEVPPVSKTLGPGATAEAVTVRGRNGYWISGDPHEIAYINKNGSFDLDTVRRAGNVLIWAADGVTFRVEGFGDRADALKVAESIS